MKIMSIVGARPNFIKLSAMHKEIQNRGLEHVVLHTGQHYDPNMSGDIFKGLEMPDPDWNLNIKPGNVTGKLSEMLSEISEIANHVSPTIVLVYGDTISSLAGGLACVQSGIPVGHIEAGVRNDDVRIIENQNRIIIDHISQFNFCATAWDLANLVSEGLDTGYFTGDVMRDMFLSAQAEANMYGQYALLTLHRPETVDDMKRMVRVIQILSNGPYTYIWPMHPRTRKQLDEYGIVLSPKFIVLPPQDYAHMVTLTKNSDIVITDSGGLQKEAYWAKKACIVIFDDAAWPQILDTENQALCPPDDPVRLQYILEHFRGTMKFPNLFGNGNAPGQILDIILNTNISEQFKRRENYRGV